MEGSLTYILTNCEHLAVRVMQKLAQNYLYLKLQVVATNYPKTKLDPK